MHFHTVRAIWLKFCRSILLDQGQVIGAYFHGLHTRGPRGSGGKDPPENFFQPIRMKFNMLALHANPTLLSKFQPPRGVLRPPKGGREPSNTKRDWLFTYFLLISMIFKMMALYANRNFLAKFQPPRGVLRPPRGGITPKH